MKRSYQYTNRNEPSYGHLYIDSARFPRNKIRNPVVHTTSLSEVSNFKDFRYARIETISYFNTRPNVIKANSRISFALPALEDSEEEEMKEFSVSIPEGIYTHFEAKYGQDPLYSEVGTAMEAVSMGHRTGDPGSSASLFLISARDPENTYQKTLIVFDNWSGYKDSDPTITGKINVEVDDPLYKLGFNVGTHECKKQEVGLFFTNRTSNEDDGDFFYYIVAEEIPRIINNSCVYVRSDALTRYNTTNIIEGGISHSIIAKLNTADVETGNWYVQDINKVMRLGDGFDTIDISFMDQSGNTIENVEFQMVIAFFSDKPEFG